MDIDEWEILPHHGFLDYSEDGCEKKIVEASNPKGIFNMNYFMCPSSPPRNSRAVPSQVVPVPIQLEPTTTITGKDLADEISKGVTKQVMVPSMIITKVKAAPDDIGSKTLEADQDSVSQVFFKKMKENEFVDMKMDSPKSSTKGFVPPPIDAGKFNFDDKSEALNDSKETKISSPRMIKNEMELTKEEVTWEETNGGLNLWKWSLNGIGAICSFGVAAATICIIIFGSNQKNKQQQQNQKMSFQIYPDEKRIKQVVHHATKLNEAISTVRGVPITRAHITFGGYYDGI